MLAPNRLGCAERGRAAPADRDEPQPGAVPTHQASEPEQNPMSGSQEEAAPYTSHMAKDISKSLACIWARSCSTEKGNRENMLRYISQMITIVSTFQITLTLSPFPIQFPSIGDILYIVTSPP